MPAPASVFIETTIPSYYVARLSRFPLLAARQAATREWWDGHRRNYALFTSQTVLDEAARGEPAMGLRRLNLLAGLPLFRSNDPAQALAARLVRLGIIPAKVSEDAAHLAIAGVHRMDFLLTWNYRHLANPILRSRLETCFSAAGIHLPWICTPDDLLGDEHGHPGPN